MPYHNWVMSMIEKRYKVVTSAKQQQTKWAVKVFNAES